MAYIRLEYLKRFDGVREHGYQRLWRARTVEGLKNEADHGRGIRERAATNHIEASEK